MRRTRTAEEKLEEEKLVLRVLGEVFGAAKMEPCLPQLALSGGITQQPVYDAASAGGGSFGEHISSTLMTEINAMRTAQRYGRPLGDTASLYTNVLSKLSASCGWDNPVRFREHSSALGVELPQPRHTLRRAGFESRGLTSLSDAPAASTLPAQLQREQVKTDEKTDEPSTQTRHSAKQAEDAEVRAEQRRAAVAAFSTLTEGDPALHMFTSEASLLM
jgi:hypothetical protein